MGAVVKLSIAGVLAIFGLFVFLSTYFTVEQYQRTVVTSWGQLSYVAEPGLHFKMPFRDSTQDFRIDILSSKPQSAVSAYTVDNQELHIIFTVFYRLPVKNIAYIYENFPDYHLRLFDLSLDRLKAELGKVSVSHVAEKRGVVRDQIKAVIAHDAATFGVEVMDFQLTNIEYSKAFSQVVEGAAAARQMVETREQEKQQAIRVAEKVKIEAEGVANAVRETAKGNADAVKLNGDAAAYAIEARGKAEGTAIKARADALKANPHLTELQKAERWDGKLPTQMLSGVVPFMQFNAPGQ